MHKHDVLMLGVGLFNLDGRQLWFDIFSSLLYAHERQYKYKKFDRKQESKRLLRLNVSSFNFELGKYRPITQFAPICRLLGSEEY